MALLELLHAALALNLVGWAVSCAHETGHYYDLTGSFTFLLLTTLSATVFRPAACVVDSAPVLPVLPPLPPRQLLASAMLTLTTLRLGLFLFSRIMSSGRDRRLDPYLKAPSRFLVLWVAQSLWAFIGSLPVLAINTSCGGGATTTSPTAAPLSTVDYLALGSWLVGFVVEVAADEQKRRFRANPANAGRYISTGLWSRSRHPNYFGQIVMGWSLALFALPSLVNEAGGLWFLAALCPLFETWLLLRVSGVPLLEKLGEERWGKEDGYRRYVRSTPAVVPRLL
jgi:steroid 5-alpha reductase family enzyme